MKCKKKVQINLIDPESVFAESKYNSWCHEGVDEWKIKIDAAVGD